MKKRIIATVILAVLSATFMIGCSGKDGEFIIGIGQFAEHGSLDNCREGFIADLRRKVIRKALI